MKNKLVFVALFLGVHSIAFSQNWQQNQNGDSTQNRTYKRPVFEKGPHKGKMLTVSGLKLEMVEPSNNKGDNVSYFVYDSLSHLVDNKIYKGSVKYVFGGPNEFLQTKLVPATVTNQYIATLEGWQEYKRAIVVLSSGDKEYTFYFGNYTGGAGQAGGANHGHGGHGQGGGHRQGMGGMGGGGMGGNSIGGSQFGGGGY